MLDFLAETNAQLVVIEYVKRFAASKEAAEQAGAKDESDESDEEMSDVESLSDDDEVRFTTNYSGSLLTLEQQPVGEMTF